MSQHEQNSPGFGNVSCLDPVGRRGPSVRDQLIVRVEDRDAAACCGKGPLGRIASGAIDKPAKAFGIAIGGLR